MAETNSNGTTGSQAAAPGAGSAPRDLAFKSPASIPAASSVPAFGGNRTGRARKDGLVPGSPEAKEADRKADAQRKRDDRAAKILADPPALPAADPNAVRPVAPALNGPGPGPGGPAALQGETVPWDPGALRPLLEELIHGSEETRIQKRRTRAVAVGLPDRIVKEVAADASYPDAAKRALALSGASGTAKILNGLGVSGKYSDAAIASTALIALLIANRRSDEKFEELIAEFKKSQAPKTGPAKP